MIDSLELQPDFAVRRGAIVQTGWKLGRAALRSLARSQRPIAAGDLVPDMAQKGVDIRIGLDIAWIALKRVADILVLVTGDSDFVPVMKFARKEGRRELKAHADLVFWDQASADLGRNDRNPYSFSPIVSVPVPGRTPGANPSKKRGRHSSRGIGPRPDGK